MNFEKVQTWEDSADCYAMLETDESIWMVCGEFEECLTMYLKPSEDDSTWFYAEDMVFSLEHDKLSEKGEEIYQTLHSKLIEEFAKSYRGLNRQG